MVVPAALVVMVVWGQVGITAALVGLVVLAVPAVLSIWGVLRVREMEIFLTQVVPAEL